MSERWRLRRVNPLDTDSAAGPCASQPFELHNGARSDGVNTAKLVVPYVCSPCMHLCSPAATSIVNPLPESRTRPTMQMSELTAAEPAFRRQLAALRATVSDVRWYPYTSLNNVPILAGFLPGTLELTPSAGSVLDVGAADGDMGFLFQSMGCSVDFLDNAATNFNDCEGLRRTAALLGKPGSLIQRDIDWGFELERDYDLVLFLGTLYHLRNPALALIRLAQRCRRALISTKVASQLPTGESIAHSAVAYLLDRREANGDPTNYFVFSPAGLERLVRRCGWKVLHAQRVGAVGRSDPAANDRDERMFLFCERVENHADLDKHHDF